MVLLDMMENVHGIMLFVGVLFYLSFVYLVVFVCPLCIYSISV